MGSYEFEVLISFGVMVKTYLDVLLKTCLKLFSISVFSYIWNKKTLFSYVCNIKKNKLQSKNLLMQNITINRKCRSIYVICFQVKKF